MAKSSIKKQIIEIPVTVGNVTIGAQGFADMGSYAPSVPSGHSLLAAFLTAYGTTSSANAVSITSDGKYLLATANATVSGVRLKFVYYPT